MRTQTFTAAKPPLPKGRPLARAMQTPRDYREGKTLLARMLRSARSQQAALRAEALLEQILGYELCLDAGGTDPVVDAEPIEHAASGPRRRWSDPVR